MQSLKEALKQIAGETGKLKAVIVDDDVTDIDVPSFAEWTTLTDALQLDPGLREQFFERLVDLNHNPDEPAPLPTVEAAIRSLGNVSNEEITSALAAYTGSKSLFTHLTQFLEDLGFEVCLTSKKPTFTVTELPFLCLVDYQIQPESESGETASAIFRHLMECSETGNIRPPFVILMSKALSDADVDRWSVVAERVGFFHFNYSFLNKELFLKNRGYLAYALLHFVKHINLSSAYFLQMNSLVNEAHTVAKQVARRLFQVTPPEALLFKNRVFEEGSTLSSELSSLFSELFSKELKVSSSIVERMDALERVISQEGLPVPQRQQRTALHRLYAELLHEDRSGTNNSPEFGDIYEDGGGKYYLVLSQECDLATGDARPRKTDRVITIEGLLRNTFPSKSEGEMIIAKPIFISGNEQRVWLWWDLGKPTVIPVTEFAAQLYGMVEEPFCPAQPLYKKRWRLRFADAEDVQHKFAGRLTRVALNVMPEFVHVTTFHCCVDGNAIADVPPIYIYEAQDGKTKNIALAPESQGACSAAQDGTFMSGDLIGKLSSFMSLEDFHKEIGKESLLAFLEGEKAYLSKASGQFKQGKKPWKGSI